MQINNDRGSQTRLCELTMTEGARYAYANKQRQKEPNTPMQSNNNIESQTRLCELTTTKGARATTMA